MVIGDVIWLRYPVAMLNSIWDVLVEIMQLPKFPLSIEILVPLERYKPSNKMIEVPPSGTVL